MITVEDMEVAVHFLKRVVARGTEEDLLLNLIDKVEKEIASCKKPTKQR
jgi:hypothetical protein